MASLRTVAAVVADGRAWDKDGNRYIRHHIDVERVREYVGHVNPQIAISIFQELWACTVPLFLSMDYARAGTIIGVDQG